MRLRLASVLVALVPALSLACSGEDDGPAGGGNGIGTGAAAGKAGSSGLQVGGRAGQAGKAGASGAAGQTTAGSGGVAGAGGASGDGGAAGQAGGAGDGGSAGGGSAAGDGGNGGAGGPAGMAGVAGAAGAGGLAGGGQAGGGQAGAGAGPDGYACDGLKRDPGELCDGDAAPLGACADYLQGSGGSSPKLACNGCLADTSQCLPFRNGQKDGDETDIDCGGLLGVDCGLGFACLADTDCEAGLRCVVGTCGRVSVDQLGIVDVPVNTEIAHGLSVRSELPLPDDTTVEFVLDPGTGPAFEPKVDVVGEPSEGPHGRAGLLRVGFKGAAGAQGVVSGTAKLKRGVLVTDIPFSTPVIARPARTNTFQPPTFSLGACEVGGAPLVLENGVVDVPLGTSICASFDTNAGSVESASLGGIAGTVADAFYQVTFVMPSSAPLFEGLPAVLPLEIVASYDAGWVTFGPKVRLTAKIFAENGSPNGVGTHGKPLQATLAALTDTVDGVDHYQLKDTVSFGASGTLSRRLEGYGGASIDLGSPNLTLTLGAGARLENVVLHGNPGTTGGSCLDVKSQGLAASLRDVEVKGCTTALEARSAVSIVRSNFHDNGVGLVLGDPNAPGTFPVLARVLDTKIETGSVGIRTEKGTATLRNVSFLNEGLGLDVLTDASVSIVRSTFTAGANAIRTGEVAGLTLASVTIDGKNAPDGLGLLVGSGSTSAAISARNVSFRNLPAGAVSILGPSNVELAWCRVEASGGAVLPNGGTVPAIDSQAGELSLLGTVVAGSPDLGVHVGSNSLAGTFGKAALVAGSAVDGGKRGIVSDGDGRLTLERAVVRGTSGPALTLASTAAYSLRRLSLVGPKKREASAPLLLVERPGGVVTGDTFEQVLLQAGLGAERVSDLGSSACTGVDDPVGGAYVAVKVGTTLCF